MKIAFYLDNSNFKDINMSKCYEGNQGVGGTAHMFLLLIYYLSREKKEILLLTKYEQIVPQDIQIFNVGTINEAIDFCKENKIDIIVFRTSLNIEVYKYLREKTQKAILWSHNFINTSKIIKEISTNEYIIKNIFVSKEQMEHYIDDDIYLKSTYIYNLFDKYEQRIESITKKNIVTYIGNIIPEKGFHILARKWKRILKEVPDAELHIIGSGKLYDRSKKLGKFNIAEERYEKRFIKYLVDENENILKSVYFHGILGSEKKEIINRSKVGICNVCAKKETFGLTALEFEAMGIPVIAYKSEGYVDTIEDKKTGYLIKSEKELANKVIYILKQDEKFFEEECKTFVEKKFKKEEVISEWKEILMNPESFNKENTNINYAIKGKYIKKIYGIIRFKIPKKFRPSSYTRIKYTIRDIAKWLVKGVRGN